MSNGKVMIIHLIVRLIKMISLYKMSYFPEPLNYISNKMKVELSFPTLNKIMFELILDNYATKS